MGREMRRREFVGLIGGVAAWPLAARAQQDGRVRRVGVLMGFAQDDQESLARIGAFKQGLAAAGWIEGRNLSVDVRWAGPNVARQREAARDLISLMPEVVLATSTTVTQALRENTDRIPIVFVGLADPVITKVVSNLARPEGNVTGFMSFEYSLSEKWLSLLKDMTPGLKRVAVLFNPDSAPFAPFYLHAAHEAGQRLGLDVLAASVRNSADIEPAIASLAGSSDGGLFILPHPFAVPNRSQTILLTAKYRVAAMYYARFFVTEGGLMSYGPDVRVAYRDGATYVDRILHGAKPADLPVQFATKFELAINLKTAKALGLTVSQDLVSIADELIE